MPATAGKYGSKDALMPSGQQKVAATEDQLETAKLQRQIAEELFNTTAGLRGAGVNQLQRFLAGGETPAALGPAFAMQERQGREDLENQYRVAREQLLSTTPTQGGQLNEQLANLSTSRAQAVGGLRTSIEAPMRQQMFQSALGLGFGQPPIALSGLSAAGGQYGQVATRALSEQLTREQQAKEEWQNIGQMAGMAFT